MEAATFVGDGDRLLATARYHEVTGIADIDGPLFGGIYII